MSVLREVSGREASGCGTSGTMGGATGSVTDRGATTGRIGVNYLFANGLAPYANYATSFLPQTAGKEQRV